MTTFKMWTSDTCKVFLCSCEVLEQWNVTNSHFWVLTQHYFKMFSHTSVFNEYWPHSVLEPSKPLLDRYLPFSSICTTAKHQLTWLHVFPIDQLDLNWLCWVVDSTSAPRRIDGLDWLQGRVPAIYFLVPGCLAWTATEQLLCVVVVSNL